MKRTPDTHQTGGKEDFRAGLNVAAKKKCPCWKLISVRIFNKYTINLSSSMYHTFSVIE
jgi:hypothetical protein